MGSAKRSARATRRVVVERPAWSTRGSEARAAGMGRSRATPTEADGRETFAASPKPGRQSRSTAATTLPAVTRSHDSRRTLRTPVVYVIVT
jgi:hypothetical protein